MTAATDERALQRYARLGGFLYLFYIVVFLPGTLIMGGFHVKGDFAQTAQNIQASELLYRTSLVLQLLGAMTAIPLGWAFYALLKQVDRNLALLALLWRVAESVFGGLIVAFSFMALSLYADGAGPFGAEGGQALAGLVRSGRLLSYDLGAIYFTVGSIIFFLLLLKSRFIPRALAVLGLVASALVTVQCFADLLIPAQAAALEWLGLPMVAAEIGVGLWLLIRGADFSWWNARSVAA